MILFILRKEIWLLFVIIALMNSCSETYENYKVDLEQVTELVTDNETWIIDRFDTREIENTTSADTATFICVTFNAYDNSFPYPKRFTARLYFNEFMREGEISTTVNKNGLMDACTISVIGSGESASLVHFTNQKNNKPLPPTFTVYSHDNKRRLISGVLLAKLYSNTIPETSKILRLTLENYRY